MSSHDPNEQAEIALEALEAQADAPRSDQAAVGVDELGSDPAAPGGEHRRSEEGDLAASLSALSGLSLELDLEDLLTRVAAFAVRAIPEAEGAGLTLLEEGRRNTVVATAPFVSEIDDIQYGLGQGPCIDAAREAITVISGSLGGDQRWPRFGGRVARLGVHSAISLPLITSAGVVGAMNVYARGKHVFDDRAAELGGVFATPAAIAVQNAHVLANARRLVTRLQRAVETQSVIDQAIGIMIARSGGTADEARDRLRTLSQNSHEKLALIAGQIVDEAARRARTRRSGPPPAQSR